MSSYRVPTPEELAILNLLADNDVPEGLSDDKLQRLIGRSPVLEAVDQLHEFGLIAEAIDQRGKPRARQWRLTSSGEEQRRIQAEAVAAALRQRIDACKIPDEAARLRELMPLIGATSRAPEPASTPTPEPKAAKPKPRRRAAPKRREPAGETEGT
ncbi:MAG: hypothetical protein EBR82_15330 [Caulobacteraceae bacterium]|nr:hypothetical protein [Caulobacteraceae bacterium]